MQEELEVVDLNGASEMMKVSRWTLYGLVRRKQVPFIRLGHRIYFQPNKLREFLEKSTENPQNTP